MRIGVIVAWYDLWVGAYWDRHKRRLYILPIPCVGFVLDFGRRESALREATYERKVK